MHPRYQRLARMILENEDERGIAAAYDKYALAYDVYSPTLYSEAVRLGKKLSSKTIKATIARMHKLPVVYNLIICKQASTKKLSRFIEHKGFRPLAEELMTVLFGV